MAHYLIHFVANFVFIFVSMAAFFAPFVAVFWWRNRQQIQDSKPHFNYFMERFFGSREADYLVLFWAALEALLWFIIPEFLLILVIFMKVHRKINLVIYDIIGTVVGSVIGLIWVFPRSFELHIPYIYPKMLTQVHSWYMQDGIWGLLYQPFSGVPYKVFVHDAHSFHFFIPLFLLVAILARISRYLVAYELTTLLYPAVHRFVRKHYAILFAFATLVFAALLMRVVQVYS